MQVVTGRAKGNEHGEEEVRSTGIADATEVVTGCKVASGGRRGEGVHKLLEGWQTGFLEVDRGSSRTRLPRSSLWMNWWSRFRSQKADFHCDEPAFCTDEVWQRSGNLRDVGSLVVGGQSSRRRRRCEQRKRPTEWQVRGSPSGTGTVIVKECVWWRNAPGGTQGRHEVQECRQRRSQRVYRGCLEGPRQPAKELRKTPQIDQDPSAIRRTSDSSPN